LELVNAIARQSVIPNFFHSWKGNGSGGAGYAVRWIFHPETGPG